MGSREEHVDEPLAMNTLEKAMIGGGTITGIIELSAAGPNRSEWNVLGVASFAVAGLGVYMNHRREQSVRNQTEDRTVTSVEVEG
jgi:hypothetical protein